MNLTEREILPQEYYEVVNDKDGRYLRYFKPLIVQPMCLNCHGTDDFLSKEIKNFFEGEISRG
jgi:hypothetical protein